MAIDDPSFAMDATCDGGTAINVAEPGGTFGFSPSPTDTAIIDPNTGEVSLATPGASYTVVYTTSGICPSSSTEVLTVLMLDDPSFTLGPTCDGAVATVTGDTGGTFSFSPDPGDGALLDTSTGAITNGTSGSTYTLEYTTSGDCPQSSTQTVTVTEEDDASFTVVPTCDGGTALPGATTTAGGTYTFDVPPTDGASIDPITGEVTGGTPSTTYTVTYGTIGVCATSETVTFTSLAIDDASFTVDPTCDGGTATITGATGGTFAFDLLPTDGASIDPATGEVTGGTPGETYSIEYTTSGICPSSSIVTFTANPLPTVVTPTALEVCDDGTPDGQTSIDLGLKDGEITGNDPGYAVSYHFDLADAQTGANALPVPYDNISNPQTVHVRVEDTSTGCYDTTTLELVVEQAPVTFDPEPLRYCDPDNDGFGFFTLTDADVEITGGALGLTVTYHETPENAESGSDAIDTLLDYGNITADMQTLYARVESATIATDCYTIEELELIVEPTPQLLEPEALEECDDISADGLAQFDLTSVEAEVLVAGQDPMDYVFSYYDDETDANGAVNAIAVPTAYTNTLAFSQTIWVRVDDPNTVAGCYKLTELELMVNPLPLLTAPSPLELCDDNDPGDEQEAFNLEGASAEILNGQGGITLTYHQTQMDADSGSSPITGPYANMSNPQTIFVRGENVFGCVAFTTVTIRVLPIPTPTPSDQIPSIELCDETVINDGLEVFDLTENEILILNGEAGVTPTYHTTLEDAGAGTNAIADPANYTNEGTGVTETIYVRVTNDVTGCFTVVNFGIRVNPLPEVVVVTDFILCELNTDGFGAFDLESKDGEVLGGQDPLQFAVSYHTSLADAEASANAILSPYTNTSNPQEIFVTITDTSTGCTISSQRFDIEVQESAQANPDMDAILYEECDDNMEVDGNPANDSLQFDLSTQDAQVLDGQDPTGYTVTYFATEADANLNVSPLPVLYQNIANPQTIYARVDNTSTICFAVAPLTLQVNPLPAFDLDPSYILCVNTNGSEAFDPLVLDTGLSASNYGFEWSLNGTVIAGATGPSLMPQQGGSYSVTVTDTSTSTVTSCSTTDTTDVVESEPPVLVVDVVTQAFAENHVIEATAGGPGDYEYSLDGGPWQDSGTFVNVSPGGHEVTARDKNGCGSVTEPVFVIDYPLYFTPNGDGNHDTWNIVGIGSTAKIYIFDRYGKLLKQISPTGSGWDGTYNGNSMPSSDYWFTVEYDEPITNQRKELKAHFTLKR
ncbi:T9SS type B sorting domain-containing protein [Winogradskyella sp. KYW1333]|uniref:T9SS type B sorting domain-containing protein n=1 Tax=Winogradskyella sp. KYW1333 TaxID=2282123 RepID=UPI0021639EBD|nr:T9SS type B sorting domain-containing protein [Winogradskyella sp. KYW1333]